MTFARALWGVRNLNGSVSPKRTVEELEKLPSIEDQSPNQRKFFSEISSALLKTHLEDLANERNWITGIIMSASILEFAGKTRLIWRQRDMSDNRVSRTRKLNFAGTIEQLFRNEMVTKNTRDEMKRINRARNEAAHELPHQVALSRQKKPNDVMEGYINSAIEILHGLLLETYQRS
jgi:hypothetical protein